MSVLLSTESNTFYSVYLIKCIFTSDKGGGKCVCPRLSLCLSVSKILKNACMDFDEMLRVDRCWDMDLNPIRIIVRMVEPYCFLRYRMCCDAEFYYVGKIRRWYWATVAAVRRGFKMVLFTASRGNTFVGGKCALPSALLVLLIFTARSCVYAWPMP